MTKWKIGCGGLIAIVVVLVAIGGWWVHSYTRTSTVEIRNETFDVLSVTSGATDICNKVSIEPGATTNLDDDWFLCRRPDLRFASPALGVVVCDWDAAEDDHPVVVQVGYVTCAGVVATPVQTPLANASPTPER